MCKKMALILWCGISTAAFAAENWSFSEQVGVVSRGMKSSELATYELETAKARALGKQWSFLPTVNVAASRSKTVTFGEGGGTVEAKSAGVDVSMNVYRFGADSAAYQAGYESVRAAKFNAQSKSLSSETIAAQALCEAMSAQMEMKIYRRRMSAARQAEQAADARYKKGILSEQELAKLKLEASGLEMALRSAARKHEKVFALLEGWGAKISDDAVWPLSVNPDYFLKAKSWVSAAKSGDLKVKVLEAEATAAKSAVTAARAAMLPSLDLSSNWSKSGTVEAEQLTARSQMMLTLSVPIFSKFSDYGSYKAAVHQASASDAALTSERLVSGAKFQALVRDALAGLDDAKELQGQITVAESLYADNLKRFERGLISVNELSIDEHRVREAEIAAVAAWSNAHMALFKVAEESGDSVLSSKILP